MVEGESKGPIVVEVLTGSTLIGIHIALFGKDVTRIGHTGTFR